MLVIGRLGGVVRGSFKFLFSFASSMMMGKRSMVYAEFWLISHTKWSSPLDGRLGRFLQFLQNTGNNTYVGLSFRSDCQDKFDPLPPMAVIHSLGILRLQGRCAGHW